LLIALSFFLLLQGTARRKSRYDAELWGIVALVGRINTQFSLSFWSIHGRRLAKHAAAAPTHSGDELVRTRKKK